jgi:hypothetical protein
MVLPPLPKGAGVFIWFIWGIKLSRAKSKARDSFPHTPSDNFAVIPWFLSGFLLVSLWFLSGFSLVSLWFLSGFLPVIAWFSRS